MPTSASMVSHAITIITILLFVHIIVSYDSMIETREALGINTNALCESCTLFADSFSKGMKRTSGYNYGGGNPSWEQKLTPYSTSEIRFVEIQEQLCLDIENDDQSNKCHYFGENHEQAVENWWFALQRKHPDLHQYLCVDKLKVCKCSKGWTEETNGRCVDIDECSDKRNGPCMKYQYCYNTEGSFSCLDCDRACEGCTGPGPGNCKACAMKYLLRDSVCVHEDEDSQNDLVFWTRIFILIYILVFLGTCIFMKNYALVLTVIGIGLGIYISLPDEIFQPTDGTTHLTEFKIHD